MLKKENTNLVNKLETKIPGFDLISLGGIPEGRTTLVAGTSGSAKTVFASQFIAMGITEANENGVFITFEETPADIRNNISSFGWDIGKWEKEGRWTFEEIETLVPDKLLVDYVNPAPPDADAY